MRKIKIGKNIILIGIIFWIVETWWFGWNYKPINDYERKCDNLVWFLIGCGIFLYFQSIFEYIENNIEKNENRKD